MHSGKAVSALLLIICCLLSPLAVSAKSHHRHNRPAKRHHHSLAHKAAWRGTGLAVGRVAGPGGSLAFGTVKQPRRQW